MENWEIFASEREILTAKITEEDIIAGKLINEKSYLKHIVSKLDAYDGDSKNPFHELELEE